MPKPRKPLPVAYPELVPQWDPKKNGLCSLENISVNSKAWWICLKDPRHEQEQIVRYRVTHGCSICRRESALIRNGLVNVYPEVAKLWHRTNNGSTKVEELMGGSARKVWWQCDNNSEHSYLARVCDMTSRSVGCPECKKEALMLNLHPILASQWHPRKNGKLRPDQIQCDSDKYVWWRCAQNEEHEWQGVICQQSRSKLNCPYCSGYFIQDERRLSICFPELAAEWHPSKNRFLRSRTGGSWAPQKNRRILLQESQTGNRRLKPADLSIGSGELVWWRCQLDRTHEWQAKVFDRTSKGSGCPFCANKKITSTNNLKSKYPKVAKLWHPTRNLPLTPDKIMPGSAIKVWWRCAKSATHIWQAAVCTIVASREKGRRGCPFCTGKRVNASNNMSIKYPDAAIFWHPDRNFPLLVSQVSPASNKFVWWRCPDNKTHLWRAKIAAMTRAWDGGTSGCPFCSGTKVASETSLLARYPEVAAKWNFIRNHPLRPDQVTAGSNRTAWWQCQIQAAHEWKAKINALVRLHNGGTSGCPYCRGLKASSENNLMVKYPKISDQWHPTKNAALEPSQVSPGSDQIIWWFCPKGPTHVWQARVKDLVKCKRRGTSGCPHCRHPVQQKSSKSAMKVSK